MRATRSRSATERPMGPATAWMAWKPGFPSAALNDGSMQSITTTTPQRRTNGTRIRDARIARLEPIDPTVPGRDAYTPANVRADPERRAVRREEGAFAAGGAT